MALSMKQANQINFRPYLQIIGLTPQQINQMAATQARNAIFGEITTPGFVMGVNSQNRDETLFYNVINLGQIPARSVKHSLEVFIVEHNDVLRRLPTNGASQTISETLFPNQMNTRVEIIGNGVLIRNDDVKFVKVKLKITYSGIKDLDPNIYFYSVTLKYPAAANLAEFNSKSVMGLIIEESDEGIETQAEINDSFL
jgi:hypothetical protein